MHAGLNWALIIPMANEEKEFYPFVNEVSAALDRIQSGKVYFVIDNVSKDKTLELCKNISEKDARFTAIWAPENRNVVDAYIRGYKEALKTGHDYIIEMDAGLSHDPKLLPEFLKKLSEGFDCVFGSRFMTGGSMGNSPFKRKLLSSGGTLLANLLLGTNYKDITSGYQGFRNEIVAGFTSYPLKSTAHFYQTELRYLLRKSKWVEIPISYNVPSPRVSNESVSNSIKVLLFYFWRRLTFRSITL